MPNLGLDREVFKNAWIVIGPNKTKYAPKKKMAHPTDQLLNPYNYISFRCFILAFMFNDILEGIAILSLF